MILNALGSRRWRLTHGVPTISDGEAVRNRPRTALAALLAGGVLVIAAAPALAGERDDWEPLTFELTLAGEVDPDDTFWIYHQCLDGDERPECIFIHSVTPVCTSEDWGPDWLLEPCEARTYRVTFRREAGITVEYAIVYGDDQSTDSSHLLTDSVAVPEGGTTVRLTFDYSLGSAPNAPPTLPDTAMSSDDRRVVRLGVALIAAALLIAGPTVRRRITDSSKAFSYPDSRSRTDIDALAQRF